MEKAKNNHAKGSRAGRVTSMLHVQAEADWGPSTVNGIRGM